MMIWEDFLLFFFSSRRRHTRSLRDWSSDVCSSDLTAELGRTVAAEALVVDDHDAVLGAHLVRVPAGRHVDGGDLPGPARIGDIDQRGAAGRPQDRKSVV